LYGINAVLDEPLDGQSVLKVVAPAFAGDPRAQALCCAIPVVSQAEIDTGNVYRVRYYRGSQFGGNNRPLCHPVA